MFNAANTVSACIIDPTAQLSRNPEFAFDNSTYVFTGEVLAVDKTEGGNDVVFEVLRVWKGAEAQTLFVFNDLRSSCSRLLEMDGEYVVFANTTDDGNLVVFGQVAPIAEAESIVDFLDAAAPDDNELELSASDR